MFTPKEKKPLQILDLQWFLLLFSGREGIQTPSLLIRSQMKGMLNLFGT